MIEWIKRQLDYRRKYIAALDSVKEASANALSVMGKYEALAASLPTEHELSTKFHWKEYADANLIRENQLLRKKVNSLQDINSSMLVMWRDGIQRYGFDMYSNWQPMDIAPMDGTKILLNLGDTVEIGCFKEDTWWIDSFAPPMWRWDVYGWKPVPDPKKGKWRIENE